MTWIEWRELFARLAQDREGGKRDSAAWEELTRQLLIYAKAQVSRQMRLRASDDVNDVVQEVLLKLSKPEMLERIREARAPGAYLFIMVRHEAINLALKHSREEQALKRLGMEILLSQRVKRPNDRSFPELQREIARLAPPERELLRLRFWEQKTIKEIADHQGRKYSAVAVQLFRLLHRLRARLGHAGHERHRGRGS